TVPGVADVNALGGLVKTWQVRPRRSAMAQLGFTDADIVAALEANNRNDGAGRMPLGEEATLVRVPGAFESLQDVRDMQVENSQGTRLPLAELADISLGALERYGVVTADGQGEAVQGLVVGLRGANAREIVDGVRAKMTELQSNMPEGTELRVFYDR